MEDLLNKISKNIDGEEFTLDKQELFKPVLDKEDTVLESNNEILNAVRGINPGLSYTNNLSYTVSNISCVKGETPITHLSHPYNNGSGAYNINPGNIKLTFNSLATGIDIYSSSDDDLSDDPELLVLNNRQGNDQQGAYPSPTGFNVIKFSLYRRYNHPSYYSEFNKNQNIYLDYIDVNNQPQTLYIGFGSHYQIRQGNTNTYDYYEEFNINGQTYRGNVTTSYQTNTSVSCYVKVILPYGCSIIALRTVDRT